MGKNTEKMDSDEKERKYNEFWALLNKVVNEQVAMRMVAMELAHKKGRFTKNFIWFLAGMCTAVFLLGR